MGHRSFTNWLKKELLAGQRSLQTHNLKRRPLKQQPATLTSSPTHMRTQCQCTEVNTRRPPHLLVHSVGHDGRCLLLLPIAQWSDPQGDLRQSHSIQSATNYSNSASINRNSSTMYLFIFTKDACQEFVMRQLYLEHNEILFPYIDSNI